ncbi:MAG: thymidine kinase [Maricaulaceae bacterium]
MAKLYFNYGAMNAGKSTILLQAAYNYEERGMQTLLLKPSIDDRCSDNQAIASRIGIKGQADNFCGDTNLEDYIVERHKETPLNCVLVDEAQFLSTEQVWQLSRVADATNIPIMCYGLRTDFKGQLFTGSAALLAIADNIKEIKTLCWCGRKAIMTTRMTSDGEADPEGTQIEIGGNERYISLCRRHWVKGKTESGKFKKNSGQNRKTSKT